MEREAEVNACNSVPVEKFNAKRGKIVAKSTGFKYQFQILESIGVPRSEIKRFADPGHWLAYFPPLATVNLLKYFCQIFHVKLAIGK